MLLLVVFILVLLFYFSSKFLNSKYKHLSSPGTCLPIIGHAHKLATKEFKQDPLSAIQKMYKTHQKNGVMYLNTFGREQVWIGDFNAIKYIFNHQHGNGRLDPEFMTFFKETRKIPKETVNIPGVLLSERDTWQQQRRFALKTLRDFGFGKQGERFTNKSNLQGYRMFPKNDHILLKTEHSAPVGRMQVIFFINFRNGGAHS